MIQQLIRNGKIIEAFWAASDRVESDRQKQTLLLQILGISQNVGVLQTESEKIKVLADKGNPYMAYAYARLHDVVQPDENSDRVKEMYYKMAANHGIGDAYAYLAYMCRDGDLGEQDMDAYEALMEKARLAHSEKGLQQSLRDMIYGVNGSVRDPEQAYKRAEDYFRELDTPDPAYLLLMGDAAVEMGRKDDAVAHYRAAAEAGCLSAFFWWATAEACDEVGNVVDRSRFMEIMQRGIAVCAADCFVMYAAMLDEDLYEALREDEKVAVTKSLQRDLQMGWMLGSNICPTFLADYYETGRYGFGQSYEQAWLWYSRGAILRSYICFEAMSRMILEDGTAPEGNNEAFGYECAYRALLLGGGEDMLEVVVRGYRNGFLQRHIAKIESVWLPKYEQQFDDNDNDDGYDDAHEYRYDAEPEREVGEDDWSQMSPDAIWQRCRENVACAEERVHRQEREWEVADLIAAYLNGAEDLLALSLEMDRLDAIYRCNDRLLDIISDHPRLKLRLLRCQQKTLHRIEAATGRELNYSETILKDIRYIEQQIFLADEGRLDEIEQKGHLRHDPVEWTKRWEEIIDKADEMAFSQLKDCPRGMGFCFGFWSERKAALRKMGVEWCTPHQMNPHVHFD